MGYWWSWDYIDYMVQSHHRGLNHHSCWDFKSVNHQQWEQTWDEWGSLAIQLSTMAHIGINATLRDILRDIIYDTLMKQILYFERSSPWHYFDNIVSDISSGSVYGICFLTFYSGILSYILFGHYFLAFYLASFLTSYLASFLASILTFLAFFLIIYIYLASILTFFPASLLALYHFIWHSIWHSLAYLLILFLAFCLVYLRRFFVVEVWRGILRSRACRGPAEEGGRGGGGGRGGPNEIKSNNPHLTGGEQYPGCIGTKIKNPSETCPPTDSHSEIWYQQWKKKGVITSGLDSIGSQPSTVGIEPLNHDPPENHRGHVGFDQKSAGPATSIWSPGYCWTTLWWT